MQKQESSNVKAIIRVRPLISIEAGTENILNVGADEQSLSVTIDQYNRVETNFDIVVGEHKNQKQMFEKLSPYIEKFLQGYNLTIFAYGQTGSGKTFTMFGKDWENTFALMEQNKGKSKQNTPLTDITNDDEFAGLIPRSMHRLFSSASQNKDLNIFCSFLQIYNEKVFDLLQDSPIASPLAIHESKLEGTFVEGLGEFEVNHFTDCLELMKRGEKNRFIRQTSMNAKSSRSHTIFQILLQSKPTENGHFVRAKFNLCDLAGSQKINKKDIMGGEHLQELKNINLSLTSLGKVISSLSSNNGKNVAHWRQSKLTRLLHESLSGNTNTIIVGAVSPSSKNKQQTMSTLKFMERAGRIKLSTKPTSISNSADIVKKLQQEMAQLKMILNSRSGGGDQRLQKLEEQNKRLKNQANFKSQDIHSLVEENRKIKQALVRMQKIAVEQMSNASITFSDDDEGSVNAKSRKEKHQVLDLQSRYSRADSAHNKKNQFLPQIQSLNKSLNTIPEQQKKAALQAPLLKRKIVSNWEATEQKRKQQEHKLLQQKYGFSDAETKAKSERSNAIRKQSEKLAQYRTMQAQDMKIKQRKSIDFAEKIKQLEDRLKKGKK